MMNDTYNNITSEIADGFVRGIVISSICAVPFLFNVSIVAVCFKSLKKEFHNSLMVALCASESLFSISFVFRNWVNTISSWRVNLYLCLVSSSVIAFSCVLVYGLILVLCIERYFTIKYYNFGVKQTFNRYKYGVLSSVIMFAFLFSLTTFIVPFNKTISTCVIHTMYGENSHVYFILLASTSTLFTVLITGFSLITAYHVWKIFFRFKLQTKIYPTNQTDTETISTDPNGSEQMLFVKLKDFCVSQQESEPKSSMNGCTSFSNCLSYNAQQMFTIEEQNENTNDIVDVSGIEVIDILEFPDEGNEMTPDDCIQSNGNKEQSRKSNRSQEAETEVKQNNNKGFELKAFVIPLIIAATTTGSTLPFVANMWFYAFSDSSPSYESQLIIVFLVVLNSFIDPVLFAWRAPEIRQKLKLCHIESRCKNGR